MRLVRANELRAWRTWRLTLRARTTVVAVVVFGAALAVGAPAFYVALNRAALSSVDATLTLQASAVANLVHQRSLPASLAGLNGETSFVQVVDAKGRVLAQSPSTEGQGPLVTFAPRRDGVTFRTIAQLAIGNEDSYRVIAYPVALAHQRVVIYAGASLATLHQSLNEARRGLFLGAPALLIVVALLTFWLVGRALRPVENLRAEVAAISGGDLHKRLAPLATRDEVARLATTMNETLDRLEVADRRLRDFVADASHELKSPLAAAQSELEVSVIHGTTADWPSAARAALGDLERVRRIVDDLTTLARFDARDARPTLRDVDLDELVIAECTRLQRVTDVAINYRNVSGARVQGEPEMLQRVVRNLLDNAVAHARTLVEVRLAQQGSRVELRVRDDGPGVPEEERARIFERFVRLDDSRARVSGGSGLGLAIVAEIVGAHDGSVGVEPTDGGATFFVLLPALSGEEEPATPPRLVSDAT
ncbi:MAG: HAMP domain-containing protein [Acidobacteriota bacterium]|nr:HAMP domain-containing protein [Acidobacteriota bacterium]